MAAAADPSPGQIIYRGDDPQDEISRLRARLAEATELLRRSLTDDDEYLLGINVRAFLARAG